MVNNSNELGIDIKKTLENQLNFTYSSLNKIFKDQEKLTIHKYFFIQKINKAKELLSYKELSVKEVAFVVGFNSVAHFSRSFKNICGQSPKSYQTNSNDRLPIDKLN